MKKIIIILTLAFSLQFAFSQGMPPSSKPDVELTEEEATLRISAWQSKVDELTEKLEAATSEKASLLKELEMAKQSLKDCKDALNALLGATQADYDAFRERLGKLKAKVRQKETLSDDVLADQRSEIEALEAEWNTLKSNKIALLPEFFNEVKSLGPRIKALYKEKKTTNYTVRPWSESNDCLWNISGRTEIYADPNMWPKIWQANLDQIRNPDVIFPGQVLQIPNKGPKDAAELKAERAYYRKKKEMSQDGATGSAEAGDGNN
ncbi:LysM peptidoglycan-binding domain-containing protein [Candidatus Kapabacteria bacterium]|nr:LysM peptidoglycan-binding domain-containing protein [Candidatus Kapabacteria bacterium]